MAQHIIKLVFIFDEKDDPGITDEKTATAQAIKEIEEQWPDMLEFDYQRSE